MSIFSHHKWSCLKPLITILILTFFISYQGYTQGTWTWVHGNPTSGLRHGVQGVMDPANTPGHRYTASPFLASEDTLWLYSGAYNGWSLVDEQMWLYDIQQNAWNWISGDSAGVLDPGVQGVAAPTNSPGTVNVGAPSWTDLKGNLWAMSWGNRTWKYDTDTFEWTWMAGDGSGASNYGTQGTPGPNVTPGGHLGENNINWVGDNGNLWWYNEKEGSLWQYHMDIHQWSWESGVLNSATNYTAIGIEDSLNQPGKLWDFPVDHVWCSWKDTLDRLYMMYTDDASTQEIWRYNIDSGMWACIQDEPLPTTAINNASICEYSSTSMPSLGKESRVKWTDDCGILWFITHDYPGGIMTTRTDLWKYNGYDDQHALVASYSNRVFGTQLVASASNHPYPKIGAISWTNPKGFWMMEGKLCNNSVLWKYTPDTVIAGFSYVDTCLSVHFENLSETGCNTIKNCLWDFGDGSFSNNLNPIHTYANSGTYNVKLVVNNCTWDSDSVTIQVHVEEAISDFSYNFNSDGTQVQLENTSSGYTDSYWIVGTDTLIGSDTTLFLEDGEHQITLISSRLGCSDTISKTIVVNGISQLIVPNVFTPNSDGINDLFAITHKKIEEYNISIFNRWGSVVYTSKNINAPWDGLNASDGVYYLIISAKGKDGQEYSYSGYLQLFR